jgi:hypothetical protein
VIQMRGGIVNLSGNQASLVRRYADALPIDRRGDFIAYVKCHLVGEPSDVAVEAAVQSALVFVDWKKEPSP